MFDDINENDRVFYPQDLDLGFNFSSKPSAVRQKQTKKGSSKKRGRPKKGQSPHAPPPPTTLPSPSAPSPTTPPEVDPAAESAPRKRYLEDFVPRNQPRDGRADVELVSLPDIQLFFTRHNENAAAAVTPPMLPVSNAGEAHLQQVVQEAGDPEDPNVRALLESQTTLHVNALNLLVEANNFDCVQTASKLNDLAIRMMAESRRTALAIQKYKRPSVRPKRTRIEQQNIAHRQQVTFDSAANGGSAKATANNTSPGPGSDAGQPTSPPALEPHDRLKGLEA